MMIKTLLAFLGIIYYSSSCCVKICNQNGIYFKICGDDLDLNINNIHCDNLYKNIFWESEYLLEAKQNNATILQNATNKTVYSELLLNNTLYPSPSPEAYPSPSPEAYPSPSPEAYPSPSPQAYPSPSPQAYPSPSSQAYPSSSPKRKIVVNLVEELDLTPSSFTTPSSIVSDSNDMVPKYSIEKTNNDELLYLLFLIIPVSLMIIVCFHYFYRSKKNRIVIPDNDIEMGDNMSVKTDETLISNVKKENPYVEIKKVIEHLIVETEKKSLQ